MRVGDGARTGTRTPRWVSLLLFGAATVAMVYPLVEGRAYGWPAWAWGLMAASLVLAAIFILWERRRAAAG